VCRLCGECAEGTIVLAKNFESELLEHFSIDLRDDTPDQHPQRICSRHTSLLYRIRSAKQQGKPYTSATVIEIPIFPPHTDINCWLCNKASGSLPREKCQPSTSHEVTNVDQVEESRHNMLLRKLCRLCGEKVDKHDKKSFFVSNFTSELLSLLGIDLKMDIHGQHPERMCSSHASPLYRFRAAAKKKKPFSPSSVVHEVFQFPPHDNEHCWLCDQEDSSEEPDDTMKCAKLLLKLDEEKRLACLRYAYNILPSSERMTLCQELGKMCKPDTIVAIKKFDTQRDIEKLCQYDARQSLREEATPLLMFLCGLFGVPIEQCSRKESFRLAIVCEVMYQLMLPKYIGPASFLKNLNMFSFTNSKIMANLMGSVLASGKYTTIQEWLAQQKNEEIICPDGDLVIMFDNEQIVGKTWSIKPDNRVKVSIITNIAALPLSESTTLQSKKDLHPVKWLKVEGNESIPQAMASPDEFLQSEVMNHKTKHYEQLYQYLGAAIEELLEEAQGEDDIQSLVERRDFARHFKICPNENCAAEVEKRSVHSVGRN
jgi:hypothetical protein